MTADTPLFRRPLVQSPLSPSSDASPSPYLATTKESLPLFRALHQKWKSTPRPSIQKVSFEEAETRDSDELGQVDTKTTKLCAEDASTPRKLSSDDLVSKDPVEAPLRSHPLTATIQTFTTPFQPKQPAQTTPTESYRSRLIAFYRKHNPEKIHSVDATLQKYKGQEEELFTKLDNKYNKIDNHLSSQAAAHDTTDPVYYLTFSTGHTIYVQLFATQTPWTVQNFTTLCKTQKYHNCIVHRIVPNFCIQTGDYTAGNGTGGRSIYTAGQQAPPRTDLWGNFADETPFVRHDRVGLLSMANNGPNRNSSQFFITLRELPHLNGKHVVFGRVVRDLEHVVNVLGKLETNDKQQPLQEVRIVDCGEVVMREESGTADTDSTEAEMIDTTSGESRNVDETPAAIPSGEASKDPIAPDGSNETSFAGASESFPSTRLFGPVVGATGGQHADEGTLDQKPELVNEQNNDSGNIRLVSKEEEGPVIVLEPDLGDKQFGDTSLKEAEVTGIDPVSPAMFDRDQASNQCLNGMNALEDHDLDDHGSLSVSESSSSSSSQGEDEMIVLSTTDEDEWESVERISSELLLAPEVAGEDTDEKSDNTPDQFQSTVAETESLVATMLNEEVAVTDATNDPEGKDSQHSYTEELDRRSEREEVVGSKETDVDTAEKQSPDDTHQDVTTERRTDRPESLSECLLCKDNFDEAPAFLGYPQQQPGLSREVTLESTEHLEDETAKLTLLSVVEISPGDDKDKVRSESDPLRNDVAIGGTTPANNPENHLGGPTDTLHDLSMERDNVNDIAHVNYEPKSPPKLKTSVPTTVVFARGEVESFPDNGRSESRSPQHPIGSDAKILLDGDEKIDTVTPETESSPLEISIIDVSRDASIDTPPSSSSGVTPGQLNRAGSKKSFPQSPSRSMAGMLIIDPLTVPVLHCMSPKRMVAGAVRSNWGAIHLSSVLAKKQIMRPKHRLCLVDACDSSRSEYFESDPLSFSLSIQIAAALEEKQCRGN